MNNNFLTGFTILDSLSYPIPKGSRENQFAPFRAAVNELINVAVLKLKKLSKNV